MGFSVEAKSVYSQIKIKNVNVEEAAHEIDILCRSSRCSSTSTEIIKHITLDKQRQFRFENIIIFLEAFTSKKMNRHK
jgi:hypothetical protein